MSIVTFFIMSIISTLVLMSAIILIPGCKSNLFIEGNEDEMTQEVSIRSVELLWDYPVKPGMEEWNSLNTEQERIDAVQIPKDVLGKLSAEEIVNLCISFPRFGYFTAFNTPQDGFVVMLDKYNIFRHLILQKDAGKSLIAAYKDAGMSGFKSLPYSNEFWTIKLDYLELLLSQKEIIQSLTSEEKIELLSEARMKYSEKINNEAFASLPGVLPTLRIMASLLYVEEYPEFNASQNRQTAIRFIEKGWLFDDIPPIDEIIKMTDNYLIFKN